jgi:hypothetical protein
LPALSEGYTAPDERNRALDGDPGTERAAAMERIPARHAGSATASLGAVSSRRTTMIDTPWVGLAALIAMFVIPFLPAWLFEGPRTVRHRPMRHVCGECGAPWANGHGCAPGSISGVRAVAPEVVAPEVVAPEPPLRGELRRLEPGAELERTPERVPL